MSTHQTKLSFDPKQHEDNINRRIMERGADMFNMDTRSQKYSKTVETKKSSHIMDTDIGEITGTTFNIDQLEQRIPIMTYIKSSKDANFDKIEQKNPFIKPKTKISISYFDQSSNHASIKDNHSLLKQSINADDTQNMYSIGFFNKCFTNANTSCLLSPSSFLVNLYVIYLMSSGDTSERLKHILPTHTDIIKRISTINALKLNKLNILLFKHDVPLNVSMLNELKSHLIIDHFATPTDYMKLNKLTQQKFNKLIFDQNTITTSSHIFFTDITDIIFIPLFTFNKQNTVTLSFYGITDRQIQYIQQYNTTNKYYDDNLNQVLEIKNKTNELSLTIILPKNKYDDPMLTYDMYVDYTKSLSDSVTFAKIQIPKIKHESKYDLNKIIKYDSLTLEKITNLKQLSMSKIIHSSSFSIMDDVGPNTNESSKSNIHFVANHPFIYYIKHVKSDTILSIGGYY